MKKAVFTIALALTFCFGLANVVSGVHTPHEQLKMDIENVSYNTYEYKEDVFDCSNMAGLMVDELDAKGYDAQIVAVRSRIDEKCGIDKRSGHAFVIVDMEVIIEPVHLLITFSEGKYGDYNTKAIDWYIETWEVIGVYENKEDAVKRSKWGFSEWYSLFR
ncbi:unnamed protein product [marine sediment metagenome]|uniref:Uncharacterized protein n=1 Tax=marine sediment metagenome TaxID=412755 RepID=X1F6L1_9ZZZZ